MEISIAKLYIRLASMDDRNSFAFRKGVQYALSIIEAEEERQLVEVKEESK